MSSSCWSQKHAVALTCVAVFLGACATNQAATTPDGVADESDAGSVDKGADSSDEVPSSVVVRRPAFKTTFTRPTTALSSEDQGRLADNCVGGEPTLVADDVGATQLIVRTGYALRHSSQHLVALFVCEHIEPSEPGAGADRPGWSMDPVLKSLNVPAAKDSDYKGSGWQRGHMAADANFKDDSLMKETYRLSNAVPQNGPLNMGLWGDLEDQVRKWARFALRRLGHHRAALSRRRRGRSRHRRRPL